MLLAPGGQVPNLIDSGEGWSQHPFLNPLCFGNSLFFRETGLINKVVLNDPLVVDVLEGNDLLHADLIPENILLGNEKPIVLDSESVSIGHLAWDAAMVLTHILRVVEGDPIASEFLDKIGFKGVDRKLVWNLVNLFKNS